MGSNILERVIGTVSPRWAIKREQASQALKLVRSYNGASRTPRTSHWLTEATDAKKQTEMSLSQLQMASHDLLRNNPWARKARSVVTNQIVGRGWNLQFQSYKTSYESTLSAAKGIIRNVPVDPMIILAEFSFKMWSQTKACDFERQRTFPAIESHVVDVMFESGSALVRQIHEPKVRTIAGIPLPPISIQVLEPEFLADDDDGPLQDGGYISHGKKYDRFGRLISYRIYRYHPQSDLAKPPYDEVPADQITHVFRKDRNGLTNGVPWLTPVMVSLNDFSDFTDAYLYRNKLANCHVAFLYDTNPDVNYKADIVEDLRPGAVELLPPGKDVKFNDPPKSEGSGEFRRWQILEISAGVGITYESMSNDYSNVNFNSGRMGNQEMVRNVVSWQEHLMRPQFYDTVGQWVLDALALTGSGSFGDELHAHWTVPRREMIDPSKEMPPIRDAARAGLIGPHASIRAMGYDPDDVIADWSLFINKIDDAELTLDIDPRKATLAGRVVEEPEDEEKEETEDAE